MSHDGPFLQKPVPLTLSRSTFKHDTKPPTLITVESSDAPSDRHTLSELGASSSLTSRSPE